MSQIRIAVLVRHGLLAAACAAVVLGGACKRGGGAVAPAPTPAAAPTPKAPPKPAADAAADAADAQWLAMKKQVKNAQARLDEALNKLGEAKRIKAEKYDVAKTDAEKKAARAEIKTLKDAAGEIYDELRVDCDKLHPKLWESAFRTEGKQWDNANRGLSRKELGF